MPTYTDQMNVILHGGPAHFGEAERIRYVEDTGTTLKLLRGNRYDHFEPTSQTHAHEAGELRVFVWTQHTYVAE